MPDQPHTADPRPAELMLHECLFTHVDRLAGLIGPRHLGRPAMLDAAANLIAAEFRQLGDAVRRDEYLVGDQIAANLVVERPGVTRPDEIVILGAHYDTVPGMAPETPGADDNASAVAVLLEAARRLRGMARRLPGGGFPRTVRFVAFTCEEPPHFYTETMGSAVYARHCRARGERITGMLCLEMVGYYDGAVGSQNCPAEIPRFLRPLFPRRGNFLAAVGNLASWRLCWRFRRGFKRATRFPLYSIVLPEWVHSIRLSDNSSFWDVGYPALMLTDTSFLRNPHYHRASDTPATLNYQRMADVTIGVAGAVALLAGADRLPPGFGGQSS